VLIKKKLPLVIILLVSIPLILLSIIVYFYSSYSLTEKSKENISKAAEIETNGLRALIYAQKKEAELMSQRAAVIDFLSRRDINKTDSFYATPDAHSVSELLKSRVYRQVELQTSFLVDSNGFIVASHDDKRIGLNISDRKYFQEAMRGRLYISNMLKSKVGSEMIIVASSPVINQEGRVMGILGNIIDIDYIKAFVGKVSIGKTGYAYLVDSEGNIIAHRDVERIGTKIENAEVKKVVEGLRSGENVQSGTGMYKYRGTRKYMAYGIVPGTKWMLVVAQDTGEMISSAQMLLSFILLTLFIFLITSICFSISFSRSVTNPVTKLLESMKKAANGDLASRCDYESKCEFGQLATGFNIMLEKLHYSYEELVAVYEELSATEEELRAQYDELQMNEEALRNSEERYKLALDGANDVIWEWNIETGEFFASDKWTEVTGYPIRKKINLKYLVKSVIHPEDSERAFEAFKAHIHNKTPYYKSEFRIKSRSGEYKWVFNRGKMLTDSEGKPVKLAGSLTDISERKDAEERIRFMAYYDSLTKLPNRALFIDKLNDELKRIRGTGKKGAVLFIDLDDFKKVNDTLGHEYGDQLLKHIAGRFSIIKREDDTVCRFSGDEFLILQPDIEDNSDSVKTANDILQVFRSPFYLKDKQVYITATIGIAVFPDNGEDANLILKNADTAMYKAKELGKNRYEFYSQEMYDGLDRKTKVERILRDSIRSKELQLYYQPLVDTETGRISGFEVLLRLNSRELGFIPPNEFISVAEETGLIICLGEWTLREACIQNKIWKDKGYKYDYIAVNISAVQLQQPDFTDIIKRVIKETGIEPQALELEITESVVMKSLDANARVLNEIRNMGIRIALDDFGTGYSSLSYLRRMPINTLKVDKSFIDTIGSSADGEAITDGIIQMAKKMNLEVVAEGVEDKAQLEILSKMKCDKVQGYLFSRPVPADESEALLKRGDFNA
jgi:diguanylate cyclase (GGDEF)-like protein/PAS domain S-box-containing protein